ncbi:MAG: DUF11 domain-containing protein [Bacilli bacterium]|nr:DUF11 domain-containing protein [Bacilli bacterium]
MTQKRKNNIIIGSLCAVVLLMVVGYAAFQSVLNITGTSKVSSNWNILITDIQTKNIVGGASNAEEPTGKGTLTATFNTNLVSPGDSLEYDITVTNSGSLNAVLEKITVSDSNNPAIKFTTTGIKEGDLLNAGGTAVLTVKVEYDNNVTTQPDNLKSELTVTLDYVQNDGTAVTPSNNVVYRWTTDTLNIGDSIEGIETTIDPTTLGKNYYLKHEINSENKITASYVCFVTDSEHCMQGGDAGYYETNKALLQGQQTWFTNNGGSCNFDGSYSSCRGGGFSSIYAGSDGYEYVDASPYACGVSDTGVSDCG